jgi:hypothetical protein
MAPEPISTKILARNLRRIALGLLGTAAALSWCAATPAQDPGDAVQRFDQGPDWTAERWADFYTQDQGSRIMPLAWFMALERADRSRFAPDGMVRYGYLANPGSPNGLPVGFFAAGKGGNSSLSMNCAACHTRQIEVDGRPWRVDGGPAIADFQTLLADIDQSVGHVLADQAEFDRFATDVARHGGETDKARLRADVTNWYARYHVLIERALPADGWGLGRLDAVSMIFNRLTGLDLGPAPDHIVAGNIAVADAPVRYPFVWNAPKQDHTQWPGFAANGDELLSLTRNLGEVYGVFGEFAPAKSDHFLLGYDFIRSNSANFDGLRHLESLVRKIGSPKWPWKIDQPLAAQGKLVFERKTADGGCVECHGEREGTLRLVPLSRTWATPLVDVGTDRREYAILDRVAASGSIEGAITPSLARLKPTDRSVDILATSVIGAILQNDFALYRNGKAASPTSALLTAPTPLNKEVAQAFNYPPATQAQPAKYEARVLYGIWATAPYLHNGSVPNLAELLTPPAQRVSSFLVGRAYDVDKVGLAAEQTGLVGKRITTGCDQLASGNSRCGHDYGTWLSPADKRALLEYLKQL